MDKPPSQDNTLNEDAEDLYQNAPCGYISILPDRTIAKINNALLNWLGYDREELVYKKKFTDLISMGGKIYYETHHDPLQRMQGYVNALNYDLVRKDGTSFPCLLNATIKKDGEGNILLARTTIFDITERKIYEKELLRAKKEAEQAAKAKAQLLSVMSHEIRTPMNAIIGLSHLLLEENPKQEQVESLRILKISAENLLTLLNSILDYSKMEAVKILLDETDFAMHELIRGIINTLKIKAEEKGINVFLEMDEAIPPVLNSDPVKISQILNNLIGNAIKFTQKGSVKITAKLLAKQEGTALLHFQIKDTGIGIRQDRLEHIFNEYEQAGTEINRDFGGTGLGLSITKKLIDVFGSSIQVKSQEGKGTMFEFNLPLRISDKALIRDSWGAKEIKSKTLKGIKVLLAEDNSVNILVFTKFFNNWELEFDVAKDGLEAFEKIQSNTYDLVLMDLQMPVMTGYETTEKVRALKGEKYQKLPIIALTASAIIGENHKIFRIGMNDFVSKPFHPKDLYGKILKYGNNKITTKEYIDGLHTTTTQKSGVINYQKFEILAEGEKEFLCTLTDETIKNFESYQLEFAKALKEHDVDCYKNQAHKIKMVSDLLEIKDMDQILNFGSTLLEQQDHEAIDQFAIELNALLHQVIVELESQLETID